MLLLPNSFNWINFKGGYFEGTWGSGEVVYVFLSSSSFLLA
jgi:hypothetical protein